VGNPAEERKQFRKARENRDVGNRTEDPEELMNMADTTFLAELGRLQSDSPLVERYRAVVNFRLIRAIGAASDSSARVGFWMICLTVAIAFAASVGAVNIIVSLCLRQPTSS